MLTFDDQRRDIGSHARGTNTLTHDTLTRGTLTQGTLMHDILMRGNFRYRDREPRGCTCYAVASGWILFPIPPALGFTCGVIFEERLAAN